MPLKQEESVVIGPTDIHMSYLPMAHMMERCVQVHDSHMQGSHYYGIVLIQATMFMCGAQVGLYQGDVKTLVDDIQALKPTLFVSVPRLLNRVYDRVSVYLAIKIIIAKQTYQVMNSLESSKAKKWIYETAYKNKLAEVER